MAKRGEFKDLTGQRFGRLVVVQLDKIDGINYWLCICDCGKSNTVYSSNLIRGATNSCGCYRSEWARAVKTIHGQASGGRSTPEYETWVRMRGRCYNPSDKNYFRYGGRGITVCDRWRNSFENFYADVGTRPSPQHSLDRYPDNNGNYEPGNVRWALQVDQCNNRRSNRVIEFRGERKTITQWSRQLGHRAATVRARIVRHGWSVEKALTHYTAEQYARCDG